MCRQIAIIIIVSITYAMSNEHENNQKHGILNNKGQCEILSYNNNNIGLEI